MKKILVGVDGSVHEREVLRIARELADAQSAQVYLVRAVGLPTQRLPFDVLSLSPDEVEQAMMNLAQAELIPLLQSLPEAQRGGAHAVLGSPMPVIEKLARELDVDLIVIGSHGHGVIDRILGSTAAKIVNHADRSVLVVRPRPQGVSDA